MPPRSKLSRRVSSVGNGANSLPPEIWSIVGEKIKGRKTLRALMQVCKLFHDLFRQFLHARFSIDLSKYTTTALAQKTLPAYLSCTKEFEISIRHFGTLDRQQGSLYYHENLNEEYAAFVVRALKAMPNLRSIRWLSLTAFEDYHSSHIISNEEVLAAVQSCSKLQDLFIQLPGSTLLHPDDYDWIICNPLVTGFRNLASLELYELYPEEPDLVNHIVKAMRNCPGLKRLGLGLSCEIEYELYPEVLSASGDCDFLERLCLEYSNRSSPLALETLRLGHGLFVYSSKTSNVGNYLAKLVNLRALKTLHIHNGLINETDDWSVPGTVMKVHWDFFSECKSLSQFSATRLDSELQQWLNDHGSSIQELLITQHSSIDDETCESFDLLNLPQLSMLFTQGMTGGASVPEMNWLPKDSELPQGTYVRKSQITVLDRLSSRAGNLKKLGICLGLENQWERFYFNLSKLPRLTCLRMDIDDYGEDDPAASTSLWPGVTKPKDIVKRYVQLMRSKCPWLQYVQVQSCSLVPWGWQIISPMPGVPVREAAASRIVVLRELEWEERRSIELFLLDSYEQQSGLPGPNNNDEQMVRA